MASPAYIWIYDENGTPINSDCHVEGREGSIEALAFSYGVELPTDKFTGTSTGTRKHETACLTKAYCPASPVLFDACCHGKTLKQLIIRWYLIDENGREQEYFTHSLDDVKVVSYRQQLRHVKEAKNDLHLHEDTIAFRFSKIAMRHHVGNIEASDSWLQRS